jgi:MFS family permease
LTAHILDITPPEQTGRVMGLKGTVGSLGNMLGPAALVLFTPLVGPQRVFLIAAALVLLLTIASGLGLRAPHVAEAALGSGDLHDGQTHAAGTQGPS